MYSLGLLMNYKASEPGKLCLILTKWQHQILRLQVKTKTLWFSITVTVHRRISLLNSRELTTQYYKHALLQTGRKNYQVPYLPKPGSLSIHKI